ncbi:MAG: glutamate 5-kinase [Cyanobacteria bacterium TGS_CYA1]|nr:glutamate 5-kinase [Cyanobacteria bacterium TGS_CYA1]
MDRKNILENSKRVVVKLGTAVLMAEEGGLAMSRFYSFVEGLSRLKKSGRDVLLVTSGAIGLGKQKLGLTSTPKLLPQKQACAAVGQGRLMALYSEAFERQGLVAAQILLTEEDISSRKRYLNLRSTIFELLSMGVIPVINENDTVSTAELEPIKDGAEVKVNFGDNDKLSALVASKIDADLLMILTDVEGLFTADPSTNKDAKLISVVEKFTAEIDDLAEEKQTANKSKPGRGGIKSKLAAAKIATQSGCNVIIAGGKIPDVIDQIFQNKDLGTMFLSGADGSHKQKSNSKSRWIAFATTVKASLVVNQGAKDALQKRKASLLPAGIVNVLGSFERGDVVSITDETGAEFARGMVNYSSKEAQKLVGMHSDKIDTVIENRNYDAMVTRDNLAFLEV